MAGRYGRLGGLVMLPGKSLSHRPQIAIHHSLAAPLGTIDIAGVPSNGSTVATIYKPATSEDPSPALTRGLLPTRATGDASRRVLTCPGLVAEGSVSLRD